MDPAVCFLVATMRRSYLPFALTVGKIKMHQIRSSDIVEGNMKSIMRLILALAAHFKVSRLLPALQSLWKLL